MKRLKIGTMLIALILAAYGLRTYTQLGDSQDEHARYATAIEQNPRDPEGFWRMGLVQLESYKRTGRVSELDEARTNFELAMELLDEAQNGGTDIHATKDDYLQANLGLGWALLYEAELDPFHDFETARVVFERIIEFAPRSERGWVGKGVAWMGAGDPNQASEAFRQAIKLNEQSPEAHFNMGLLLLRIEEFDAAALEFQRSAELRSENYEDLAYLARTLQDAQRDDEAVVVAQDLIERYPLEPDPLIVMGIASAKQDRHAVAVNWFDKALALRANHGAAHLHRGKTLAVLNQRTAAVKSLRRACELLPNSFEAHHNLMVLFLASDKPETAVPIFLIAYRLRPRGEVDIRMARAAEGIHRDDTAVLTILATIDADRGDIVLAESWARRALEVDPQHAPSKFILGTLLKQRKEYVEAYDLLHEAADALLDSYEAQMEFAQILLDTNQEIAAEPYFQRALMLLPQQQGMSNDLKRKTGERIYTALEKIEELKLVGPPAPPANG